jgi:hypothetical protein
MTARSPLPLKWIFIAYFSVYSSSEAVVFFTKNGYYLPLNCWKQSPTYRSTARLDFLVE